MGPLRKYSKIVARNVTANTESASVVFQQDDLLDPLHLRMGPYLDKYNRQLDEVAAELLYTSALIHHLGPEVELTLPDTRDDGILENLPALLPHLVDQLPFEHVIKSAYWEVEASRRVPK